VLSFKSVTGKVIVAVVLAIVIIQSASVTVAAVGLSTRDASAIPQAHNQSHVSQAPQIPQINLVCSDKPLNISTDPNTWDQAFADAQKIKLTIDPWVKDYKYAGSNDYAAVRVMCDPNRIYFLGEYMIPSDSGPVTYKPIGFTVFIDTMNNKNLVPQKEDYKFEIHPSNAVGYGITHGLFYREGTGDINKGYYGWGKYTTISDVAFGREGDSMMSTSIFQQPHPVMYFDLAKSYINIQNPFGLGLWIFDANVVGKDSTGNSWTYTAIYPTFRNSGFFYQSASWADVYSSYPSPVTTTSQISTTQLTTLITTPRSSIQETQTIPAQSGLGFIDWYSPNFLLTVTAMGIVTVLIAVCIYYRYARKLATTASGS
jgi:hypothetical protein